MRFTISCPFCASPMAPQGQEESFGERVVRCRRWELSCVSCGRRERVTVTLTEVREHDRELRAVVA